SAALARPSFPTRRSSDLRRRSGRPFGRLVASRGLGAIPLRDGQRSATALGEHRLGDLAPDLAHRAVVVARAIGAFAELVPKTRRSEEHTSELQSRENLVC